MDLRPGDIVVDATLGFGGHSREILKQIGQNGRLVAIEKDKDVLETAKAEFLSSNITLEHGDFRNLRKILDKNKIKSVNCTETRPLFQGRITAKELASLLTQSTATPKPIWFNEYGTPENKKLTHTIDSMFKERDAADAWFWFTLRDLRPNNRWNYGLTDYNFEKKDSFIFFQKNMSIEKATATRTPTVNAQ